MSFSKCMTSLSLHGKIPARELKDAAAEYQKRGMSANAAMIQAVEDKIEMLQMEERGIVKAVRGAYEEQGGKKRKPRAKALPAPRPEPAADDSGPRFSVADDAVGITDTPAFKKWFGESKVVDENGEPLVVYHGTARDFNEFKTGVGGKGGRVDTKGAIFATDSPQQAAFFARMESRRSGEGPNLMPVYMNIANPLTYDYGSRQKDGEFSAGLIEKARDDGHDGVILRNVRDAMEGRPADVFIVFDPKQIKSAIGNNGEFDPDNADIRYSVGKNGQPVAEFGPVHTEYRDDPAGAVKRLLADKTGEAVVSTGAMGDISLIYGDDKTGLGHVARRRGEEFMDRLPALLRDGKEYTKPGQTDRVFIGNDRDEAVVRLQWDGKPKKWLLSAYEKYPDTKAAGAPQSRRSEQAAPAGKNLTRDTLRDALTKGDVLGPVINSMIESGLVVLHDGPSQLPKGAGRKVKGVQAVTMPDGTVHMVASNLTPDNARAVMLHEAFHQGGKKLIGTEQWASMMGRLGSLYSQSEKSTGKAKEFFDRARERVAAAKKKGAVAQRMEVEEFAAYAIEEYETNRDGMPAAIRKWVEDLIGLVKAWMVKRYGRQIGQVTPAQLAAMAKWAMMDVAVERRGEMFGPVGEMFSADGEQTLAEFTDEMEKKYPGIRLDMAERRNGDIHLSRIVVPAGERERGTGTAFMNDLTEYADATGKRIILSPSNDFGGTKSRLIDFYKRFGFVENKGRNKDYEVSESMYREPAAPSFSAGKTQTDTPAFRKWFGDSKVVDENGEPLVVYHGTPNGGFSSFDAERIGANTGAAGGEHGLGGFYFTSDANIADTYSRSADVDMVNEYEKLFGEPPKAIAAPNGSSIYPVYLSLQNPLVTERGPISTLMVREAKQRGHDGIISGTGSYPEYVAFSPEQIKSAIGNTGEFDPDNTDIRFSVTDDTDTTTDVPPAPNRYTPPAQNLARRMQAAVQDNQNRVKEVQERIMDKTGLTTLGKADLYGAETNRPGRIAARREDFANKMLKPLVEKLAKAGHTPEQLASLLHAMHAKERNEAIAKINPDMPDGGSGMTNDQAEATLALHKDDRKLHALAKEARAIARATLDLKLAYGLITPEYHDLLTTQYENYVPLKGDAEYGPKIKRAMGHEEREEHILENVARDYEQAVVVGEKNLARQSLLQMALKFPDDDLWTVGVPPKGRYVAGKSYSVERNGKSEGVFTSMPQVNAFLEAKGAEAANYKVLDSAGEQVVEFTKPLQDNEVMVYVNGDPVRIQIKDETLARQLRPLDAAQMGPILEGMRSLNRYLSKIYTGYNPAFILRNAARDAMTGSINMLGNQGAAVTAKAWAKYPGALKAMFQWAKSKNVPDSKMGRYLDEYRQNGGKTGASYMSDLEAQAETIQHMYDDAYGASGYLRDGKRGRAAVVAGRKIIGGMAHVVEVMNQATENALRLALYTALREEGISAGRAAQAAKGVTVDFDRKGAQTGTLGALYLFFNPAVQGVANGMKTLAKGEHKAQAWAALGGLALLGYYAAAAGMGDDKDRWLGEAWDKRTKNLMLNVGDKQIRVPLSQEFAPAYALGVALAEGMNGEKPTQTAARIVSSFIDAYFPLAGVYNPDSDNHAADIAQAVTPTVARPFIESAMNRNAFGSQIVPEAPQTKDRPDNLKMNRATKGTPYDVAAQALANGKLPVIDKTLGEIMGSGKYENDITKVSPETIKSLWRTYTGGLGQFVTDSIGVASMGASDPSQVEASEVPIINDFVHEQGVKPIRGRYYALSRDARRAATEFQMAKKAGDGAAMDEIVKDADKLKLVSLGKLIEKTGKAITALADEKVDVQAQADLSAAEKRAKVREIEQEEEKIYREAIEAFK